MAKGIYVGVKDEYKVLDYIQSSGTQYIDFGFPITTKTFKVQMQAMYFSSSTNEQPLISIWTSSYNYWNVFVNASNQMSFYYNAHLNGSTISFNSVLNLEFGTDEYGTYGYAGKRWVSVNGSVSSTSTSLLNTNNTTLKLFTRGDLNGKTSGRVYYVKQYNGTSLVHDIVPVKRVSDGLVGMYDKTTKKFHKNSGTGVFTYGAETGETINGDSVSRKVKSAYISVPLPDGYQQVEYIQSTGTQYIDTGASIFSLTNFKIELDMYPNSFYNYNSLWGSTYDADTFESWFYSDGILAFRYNNVRVGNTAFSVKRMRIVEEKKGTTLSLSVDGSQIATGTTTASTATNPLILFLSGQDYGKYKLYSCKIYNDKTLIRDFIPCYRKSDSVAGLYDLVNKVFYTNSGTGVFSIGSNSNPLARKLTSIYIGVPCIKLTNMLPAINGASGYSGSGTISASTAHTKYANNSLMMTGSTSLNETTATSSEKYTLDSTHKYYARVEIYQETPMGNSDFYWPIAEPLFYGSKTVSAANTWTRISAVNNRSSFTSGSYQFRLDFNNSKNSGYMWFDGVMLIDLTAAFGSGNEPDVTWCDTYIPYFTGSSYVEAPNLPSVARKVF